MTFILKKYFYLVLQQNTFISPQNILLLFNKNTFILFYKNIYLYITKNIFSQKYATYILQKYFIFISQKSFTFIFVYKNMNPLSYKKKSQKYFTFILLLFCKIAPLQVFVSWCQEVFTRFHAGIFFSQPGYHWITKVPPVLTTSANSCLVSISISVSTLG